MTTRITVKPNGPLLLSGPVDLVDPAGNTQHVPAGKAIALCRCGQSGQKPWCDGSHNRCGFKAADPAPVR